MRPVAVFRHATHEGPGYLGDFLTQKNIPWQLIKIDAGEPVPASPAAYSGIVLMGGPMSVNDPLPWIAPLLGLIRVAVAQNIPVLGHCLGGQLLSRALGGVVTKNAVKEMGWGPLEVSQNAEAQHWFGKIQSFNGFHWHGETFSLPANAVHLLASPYCAHQAFSVGPHLAFQCHIEMTVDLVKTWCDVGQEELQASADSPAVQQRQAMEQDVVLHCFFLNKVAEQVYSQWIQGLMLE